MTYNMSIQVTIGELYYQKITQGVLILRCGMNEFTDMGSYSIIYRYDSVSAYLHLQNVPRESRKTVTLMKQMKYLREYLFHVVRCLPCTLMESHSVI